MALMDRLAALGPFPSSLIYLSCPFSSEYCLEFAVTPHNVVVDGLANYAPSWSWQSSGQDMKKQKPKELLRLEASQLLPSMPVH